MLFALLRTLLPVLLKFITELLNPGSPEKLTSALGRASAILNVLLLTILIYTYDNLYTLNGVYIRNLTIAKEQEKVLIEYRKKLEEDAKEFKRLRQ